MSHPDQHPQKSRVLPGYFSPAVPPVQQQHMPAPAPSPHPAPAPTPPVPSYQQGRPYAYLQRDPASAPLYGASFVDALGQFFRKYGVFSGRAGRSEFWWIALFMVVLTVVGALFDSWTSSDWVAGIYGMFMLACIVPSIALTVRRLHDANLSGGPAALALVPYVGWLVVLVMAAMPANPAGARYDKMRPNPHPHTR